LKAIINIFTGKVSTT